MDRRAVFLDVDGTLVNDRGLVPEGAREAVTRARANGHLVFLCTGRSTSELWSEILDIGFDGVIAGAGAYVEHDGQVLAHHSLTAEDVARVVEFLAARGIDYFLESNDGLFGSANSATRLRELIFGAVTDEDELADLERGMGGFIDSLHVGTQPSGARVNKIFFLDSPVDIDEIRSAFGDDFQVLPAATPRLGPNSGEIALPGVHKASGIRVLTEHLGIADGDTLGIGDGYNDLEMLQHVAVGVAMGNAPQPVKDVADDVTGGPDEDGIRTAFIRHGLI